MVPQLTLTLFTGRADVKSTVLTGLYLLESSGTQYYTFTNLKFFSSLSKELEEQHKKEKLSLEEDKNQLQLELENLKQALGDKLTSANQEARALLAFLLHYTYTLQSLSLVPVYR